MAKDRFSFGPQTPVERAIEAGLDAMRSKTEEFGFEVETGVCVLKITGEGTESPDFPDVGWSATFSDESKLDHEEAQATAIALLMAALKQTLQTLGKDIVILPMKGPMRPPDPDQN